MNSSKTWKDERVLRVPSPENVNYSKVLPTLHLCDKLVAVLSFNSMPKSEYCGESMLFLWNVYMDCCVAKVVLYVQDACVLCIHFTRRKVDSWINYLCEGNTSNTGRVRRDWKWSLRLLEGKEQICLTYKIYFNSDFVKAWKLLPGSHRWVHNSYSE